MRFCATRCDPVARTVAGGSVDRSALVNSNQMPLSHLAEGSVRWQVRFQLLQSFKKHNGQASL